MNAASASATSAVFGLHKRQAVYREGLGVVLLPKDAELPASYLVPQRFQVSSALPYPQGHGKPRDTVFPEVDYTQLQRGLDQAFSYPDRQRTRTVAILYKNHLMAARHEGFGPQTPVLGWSMTKSVLATLYGVLQYQGRLDVSEKPGLPQWEKDERKEITYDHLLRMQSGLRGKKNTEASRTLRKCSF